MNSSKLPILACAASALGWSGPVMAQDALVDLDTAIRCSAAFGIVAAQQQRGGGTARTDYPPLADRGREFFVQTAARLMDERKLSREQVQSRMRQEAAGLQADLADGQNLQGKVMGPCLTLLDAVIPIQLPPPR